MAAHFRPSIAIVIPFLCSNSLLLLVPAIYPWTSQDQLKSKRSIIRIGLCASGLIMASAVGLLVWRTGWAIPLVLQILFEVSWMAGVYGLVAFIWKTLIDNTHNSARSYAWCAAYAIGLQGIGFAFLQTQMKKPQYLFMIGTCLLHWHSAIIGHGFDAVKSKELRIKALPRVCDLAAVCITLTLPLVGIQYWLLASNVVIVFVHLCTVGIPPCWKLIERFGWNIWWEKKIKGWQSRYRNTFGSWHSLSSDKASFV